MDFFNLVSSWQTWIVIVTGFLVIYKYLTRNYGYWETQGVPSEKGYPIVGSEFSLFTRPMHEVDLERAKKHGRIYGTYMFGGMVFNVADPDIIRLILVKDFPHFVNRQSRRTHISSFDKGLLFSMNDDWKRIRSVVTPTFTTGKIKKMSVVIKAIAKRFSEHMLEIATEGKVVDMKRIFSAFSVDVLGSCAFGVKFDSFKNPNHPFLVNTTKIFEGGKLLSIFILSLPVLPKWMTSLKMYLMEKIGLQFFVTTATEIIQERRKISNKAHIDFIQLMLDAKEDKLETSDADKKELQEQNSEKNESPYGSWTKTLSEEEIVAQCATFLMAGHESIATVCSFVSYALALHPKYQEILHQEIDATWEKHHGELDYDMINKMPYLNAVINETIRRYTGALRIMRVINEEYTIPNTGITLPKNCTISIPAYVIHHDPEFFPNPDTFDPDRFLPENKDSIKPYTFMPFGDGPRNCVGMRFALIEMKFCLAHLLRSIKFVATAETMKPLVPVIGTGAFQTKTMMVKPEKRVF